MKDFLNRAIAVGDKVAFVEGGYRNLRVGTVRKLTPSGASIETATGYKCHRQSPYLVLVEKAPIAPT